jgi:hypothetical protein
MQVKKAKSRLNMLSGSVAQRDLIPALKGHNYFYIEMLSIFLDCLELQTSSLYLNNMQ